MNEDYVVICGNCGGEDLEHRVEECEVCGKDVCRHCTAGRIIDDEACCDHHANVHKGECCVEVNGVEEI